MDGPSARAYLFVFTLAIVAGLALIGFIQWTT